MSISQEQIEKDNEREISVIQRKDCGKQTMGCTIAVVACAGWKMHNVYNAIYRT